MQVVSLDQRPGCEIRILLHQPSEDQLGQLANALADVLVASGFDNQDGLNCVITLGPYEWPRDIEAGAHEYMEDAGWFWLLPGAAKGASDSGETGHP
jgi:hypothetical protein